MKTKLRVLAMALVGGGTMFAQTRLSIGVGIGGYAPGAYPPPAYASYRPACPGPGYSWVDGYWAPGHNWVTGFWRAPAPRFRESFRNNYRDNYRDNYRANDRNQFQRDDHRNDRRDFRSHR